MLFFVLAVVAGLALLTKAADELVRGSARLAVKLRISAVVIGAVLIGFGTSAPELLVSVLAAGQGTLDIAIGNVVGSNIANLTVVLGVTALILPLGIGSSTLAREAPLATGATVLLALLVQGGITRLEGVILLAGLIAGLLWMLRGSGADDAELAREVEELVRVGKEHRMGVEALRTTLGLLGTLAGAQLLVFGAQGIAREAGVAEGLVGLSVVALGTSLPELMTGIQAARRREPDLIVGNVLGSNMFNSFAVAGASGLVGPGPLDTQVTTVAVIGMVVLAVAVWLFMRTRRELQRWEAVVLLATYPVILGILAL